MWGQRPEETALAVFRSERFKQYVSRNYEFTIDELRQIERGAGTMTLRKISPEQVCGRKRYLSRKQ